MEGAGTLLQHLRDGVPRTRSELAAATGLGRSTVAQRVDALLASSLVGAAGEATSSGGRPPTQFAFNPTARVVLAADVGATHVRLAVTDLAATVLASELVDLDIALGPEAVLRWVLDHGRKLLDKAGRDVADLAGVGVGSARSGRARHRSADQSADHAGLGRVRRAAGSSTPSSTASSSSTTTST